MAYQRKDQTEEEQNGGGLLGGYLSSAGGKLGPTAPQISAPPMGNSGPSVTGFVNFDRIYNANEATAKRDAGKMSSQAQGAAQRAQGGLAGLQQQFSSQSKAVGTAPSANDYARAKGGGTPFAVMPPMNTAVAGKFGPRDENASFAPDTEANWKQTVEMRANAQYGGPASLGEMSGYKSVLADYGKADDALDALGSDAALEGALAKQKTGPYIEGGNRLDAALTGAAGRPEFARVREQYKGINDELPKAVKASGEEAAAARATAQANAAANRGLLSDYEAMNAPGVAGDEGAPRTQRASNPWGYSSYDEMMGDGGAATDARDGIHQASQYLDPVSWFQNELGKGGLYDGQTVSEGFRSGVGLGGDELNMQNLRSALQQIERQYGKEAAQWLFDNMGEENWGAMQGKNGGAIYGSLQQMLEASDFWSKQKASNREATGKTRGGSTVTSSGGGGDADQGTTANEEAARNRAYAEGWGSSYDEQFRNGNRNPQRGG